MIKNKYLLFLVFFLASFVLGSQLRAASCSKKLIRSIEKSNYKQLRILLKAGEKVNCSTKDGLSPLHIAAKSGNIKILRALLQKKNPFIPTDRFMLALPVAALIATIFLVLSVLFGIFYSHKLAGPIYRIEKTILKLINGSRNFRVQLRKKDEFKKLADTTNKLLEYTEQQSHSLFKMKDLIEAYEKNKDPQTLSDLKLLISSEIEELSE